MILKYLNVDHINQANQKIHIQLSLIRLLIKLQMINKYPPSMDINLPNDGNNDEQKEDVTFLENSLQRKQSCS